MTELTLDSLRTAFHLPREAAAEALGVTVNELKKALKLLKIERWPFRKLSSLQALQADLEEQLNELESSDDNRSQALELREMHARIGEDMAKIRLDPNHPLDEALHKLRLQNYKARFIKQHGGGPAGKGRRSSASTARPSPGAALNPLLPKAGAQGTLAGPGAADGSQPLGPNFGAEPTQSTGSASSGARRAASSAQLKRSADMASMGLWGPSGSSASGLHSLSRSRRALGQPPQPPLPRSVAPPVVNLPDGRARGMPWGRPQGYNGQPGAQGHMQGGAGAMTLAALPGLPEDDVLDGLGTGYRSAYSAPLYDETTASHMYGHTARGPVGHSSEAQLNRQYSGVSGLKDGVAAIKLEQYDGQYSGAGSSHGRLTGHPSLDQVAAGGTPPWMVPLGVPNWQPQTSQASRYTSCPADWGQQQQGGLPPAQQQQQQQTYQPTRFGQAGMSQPLPGPGGQPQQQQPQQQPWDMAPRRMRTVTPKATPLEEMLAELAQTNPVNPDRGAMSMPFGAPMHSMQQQQRQQYMQGGMSMPVMGQAMFDGGEGGVIQGNPSAWPVSNSGLEQHAMAQQSGQIGGQAGATAGASGVTYQQPPRSTVLGHEPPLPSSYFLLNSDDEDDDEISRLLSGAPSQPLAGGLARAPRSMNVMQQAAPEYAYRAPNTAPMPAYNSDVVFGAGGQYGHASHAQAQGLGQGVSGQPGAPMRIANEVVHQHGEPQVQPVPATVVTTGHNVQPATATTQQWGAEAHGFQTQQQQQLQHHHSGVLPQLQNHHQLLQQHHSAGSKPPGLTRHSMPARAPAFVTLQHSTDGASAYGSLQALSMPPAGESMRFGVVQQQLQQQPEVQVNPKGEGHQPQVAAWLAQQQQMAGHVYQQQPPQQMQQAGPTQQHQQQQQQQQALGDRAWPPSSGTVSVGALLEGLPDQGPGSVNGTTAAGYGNQMDTNMDPGAGPTMAELQQLLDDEMGL